MTSAPPPASSRTARLSRTSSGAACSCSPRAGELSSLHRAAASLRARVCLFPLSAPSHAAASRVRPLMADVAADALRLAASVNALGSAAANAVFTCPAAAPEEEAMREGARETGAGEAPRLRRRVRCAS